MMREKVKNRYFLAPERKLVDEVADWLCGSGGCGGHVVESPSGAKSLSHVLVIVPTAQSGRRLRLALAKRAAGNGWGGLVPPHVMMTSSLLEGGAENTASEAVEIAA